MKQSINFIRDYVHLLNTVISTTLILKSKCNWFAMVRPVGYGEKPFVILTINWRICSLTDGKQKLALPNHQEWRKLSKPYRLTTQVPDIHAINVDFLFRIKANRAQRNNQFAQIAVRKDILLNSAENLNLPLQSHTTHGRHVTIRNPPTLMLKRSFGKFKTHDKFTRNDSTTGATVDVIDDPTFQSLRKKIKLEPTKTKIFVYGSSTPLKLHGCFQASIESKSRYTVSTFYVVDGPGGNPLSAKTAQDLALIQLVNTVKGINATKEPPQAKQHDVAIVKTLEES